MNTENSDLEAKPSDHKPREHAGTGDRPGPGKPSEPPKAPKAPPETPPAAKRSGSFTALLALLFALLALALAAWTWWQDRTAGDEADPGTAAELTRLEARDRDLGSDLARLAEAVDRLSFEDSGAALDTVRERQQADRSRLADAERALQEQMALSRSLQAATTVIQERLLAAEAAVSGLSTRELDAGSELDLAEVDYLLRLASERLVLFADPKAADDTLAIADRHLAALDNPMYFGVRQDIAAARRDLADVAVPDYLDISGRLDGIQKAVPSLLFLDEQAVAPENTTGGGEGWWDKTRDTFASLVTVRRSSEGEIQRLTLEDKDFVRQRTWMQLEAAQLALMRRDQDAFRNALARAGQSVTEWFAPGSGSYDEIRTGLEELTALEIDVDLPDISTPWTTLRLLRQAAPVPLAEPPAAGDAAEEQAAAEEGTP